MNFYSIKLGLAGSVNQAEVIQTIRSGGGDAIQTSDGLLAAFDAAEDELIALVEGVRVEAVDVTALLSDDSVSGDQKTFVESFKR